MPYVFEVERVFVKTWRVQAETMDEALELTKKSRPSKRADHMETHIRKVGQVKMEETK